MQENKITFFFNKYFPYTLTTYNKNLEFVLTQLEFTIGLCPFNIG